MRPKQAFAHCPAVHTGKGAACASGRDRAIVAGDRADAGGDVGEGNLGDRGRVQLLEVRPGEIGGRRPIRSRPQGAYFGVQIVVGDRSQRACGLQSCSRFFALGITPELNLGEDFPCGLARFLGADLLRRTDFHSPGAAVGSVLRNPGSTDAAAGCTQPDTEAGQVVIEKDNVGLIVR